MRLRNPLQNPLPRWAIGFFLVMLLGGWARAWAEPSLSQAEWWAHCEGLLATSSDEKEPAECFRKISKVYSAAADAVEARLGALRLEYPDNPWLPFFQASIRWGERREETAEIYQEAAEIAHRSGKAEAEVEIRRWRARYLLQRLGNVEEGRLEVARLEALATSSQEPLIRIKARTVTARASTLLFDDLEKALHVLYAVERQGDFEACRRGLAEIDDCLQAERDWLAQVTTTTHTLGLYADEERYLKRLDTLTPHELPSRRAALAFRWAAFHASGVPTEAKKALVRVQARKALELADGNNPSGVLLALLLLGQVEGAEGGMIHLDRCLELTEQNKDAIRLDCLVARAELEAASVAADPGKVAAWLEEARELAAQARDPWSGLTLRQARARIHWLSGDHRRGVVEGEALLAAIERHFALQPTVAARARLRSVWWELYHWLAGRLLEPGAGRDVGAAFRIMERARARALLEARREGKNDVPAEIGESLADLERQRASLQLRLWTPSVEPSQEPETLKAELRDVENSINALWHRVESEKAESKQDSSAVATLEEVESALGRKEAMLAFQLSADRDLYGRHAGGSWVILSTRAGRSVHRLPDEVALEARLRTFLRPEYPEVPELWHQLHAALLAEALAELPDDIDRLIVLPDGALHQVPFELLSPAGGSALAKRFKISYAPSATLWLEWRRRRPEPSKVPALVLADPQFGQDDVFSSPGERRSDPRGALEKAGEEGRLIVDRLAGGSRLLLGLEASEEALFRLDLEPYALLHFATHAKSDDLAHRSAIFLTAGSSERDGLLQPHEIASLDLEEKLIVLANCESGAGQTLRGEGVQSLARAFFVAGARSVVASRRPIDDDQAARFFKIFYRHLAAGRSVGDALFRAQRDRREAGDSAHSWSGLIVLGDAEFVPFPGGLESSTDRWLRFVTWIALGLALILAAVLWVRKGRSFFIRGAR